MALRTPDSDTQDVANDKSQAYYDEQFNKIAQAQDLSQQEKDAIPDYDRKKDGLDDHPISAGDASGKSGDIGENIKNNQDAEANPMNFTGGSNSNRQNGTGFFRGKRKKGPIALIITLLFGGAVGIGGFFGVPGLLLVNMSEVITNKLNTSLPSLDTRSNKIIASKISGTTSGLCSTRVSLFCKYSSLSKDEIKGFNDNGIILKDADGHTINPNDADTPRKTKPASYSYKGQDTPAKEFPSRMANDPVFKSDVTKAMKFNAKYGSLSGRAWRGVGKLLGISKKDPFSGKDSADTKAASKVIAEDTKDGTSKGSATDVKAGDPNEACTNPSSCTPDEAKAISEGNLKANGLINDSSIPDGTTALDEVDKLANGSAAGLDAAANTIKITGYLDTACSIRGLVNAVGFAAKTVRYQQLARYAMIFLTTASMIKAGTAQPGNVSALGDILTKTTTDNPKSATDSLAYRNVAYGDTGTLDTVASQYLTAAGLTGVLIGLTATVDNILGGPLGAKSTCHTLANPFVQIGSLIAGVGLFFIPGGQAAFGIKEALMLAGGGALVAAQFVLPAMLKNIIAGNVINDNTFGDAAGSAFVSGSGATLSTAAQFNGNAPLTPDQAVAFSQQQDTTLAQYAKQDQLAYSPLDPTHANTFLGSLVTQMSRYSSNISSVSGTLSTVGSLVSGSFGSIFTPYTKAANTVQNYTTCQDEGYKALNGGTGVATDLFCNPIRGIPQVYLNNAPDPATLYTQYLQAGMIDESGAPQGDYATFVNTCITRQVSYDNEDGGDSSMCFIPQTGGQDIANKYIQYIDGGALDQMENGYEGSAATTPVANITNPTTPGNTIGGVMKDDYPWPNAKINTNNPYTHYNYRECVDFVNWRLNEQAGVTDITKLKTYFYGTAYEWKDKAVADGKVADNKPTLGSVAWWGITPATPSGHVAIVSAINNGVITIEQYNGTVPDHTYNTVDLTPAQYANVTFLHIHDIGSSS